MRRTKANDLRAASAHVQAAARELDLAEQMIRRYRGEVIAWSFSLGWLRSYAIALCYRLRQLTDAEEERR